MFTITITLKQEHHKGLTAVDIARRLGLRDTAEFTAAPCWGKSVLNRAIVAVDEGFARTWFTADQIESDAVVTLAMLAAGDAALIAQEYTPVGGLVDSMVLAGDMSAERIRELYIFARFAACREQSARLTAKVDELLGQLDAFRAEGDNAE